MSPRACRELERAHAQVACRDARQHGAGQRALALHRLASGGDRQRPRRRDAQRVHGLADQRLAQHQANGGLAVAAARERRAPGALERDVATLPGAVDHLAEQQRATVAQLRRKPPNWCLARRPVRRVARPSGRFICRGCSKSAAPRPARSTPPHRAPAIVLSDRSSLTKQQPRCAPLAAGRQFSPGARQRCSGEGRHGRSGGRRTWQGAGSPGAYRAAAVALPGCSDRAPAARRIAPRDVGRVTCWINPARPQRSQGARALESG